MIEKVGRRWFVDGKAVDSYELYAVWGTYTKVRPSQMTPELVRQYATAKKNKTRPFEDKVIYRSEQ